jgi:hypothetical protein
LRRAGRCPSPDLPFFGLPFFGLPFFGLPFFGLPTPASGPSASPDRLLCRGLLCRGVLCCGPLCGLPGDAPGRGGDHRQCRLRRNRQFADWRALLNALLLGRDGRGHAGPSPHPAEHHDLVLFRQRRQPAPGGRFPDVAHLGNDQLGQALTLQYRTGRQPGEQAGRQHIQPEQIVAERQPEEGQKDHVGHRDSGKNGYLANRQRHWKPEIVQLV